MRRMDNNNDDRRRRFSQYQDDDDIGDHQNNNNDNQSDHNNNNREESMFQNNNRFCDGCKCCGVNYSSQISHYLKNAYLEMKKRKFNYCLGSLSVFIVVLVASLCFTLISKAPVVFLQQAEASVGQWDIEFTPNYFFTFSEFLNHTHVEMLTNFDDQYSYHTPRAAIGCGVYPSSCQDNVEGKGFVYQDTTAWAYTKAHSTCNDASVSCLAHICHQATSSKVQLIDSQAEQRMGLGRYWPYSELSVGEALIGQELAQALDVSVGDTALIDFASFDFKETLLYYLHHSIVGYDLASSSSSSSSQSFNLNTTSLLESALSTFRQMIVPVKVAGVYDSTYGKFADGENRLVIMEYKYFMQHLLDHLHPIYYSDDVNHIQELAAVHDDNVNQLSYPPGSLATSMVGYMKYGSSENVGLSLYHFAHSILMNLPPQRTDVYVNEDYTEIQSTVVEFASRAMYYIGFPQVEIQMEVLATMQEMRFLSLFLGLILSVILTILFILSTMLMYSLLIISIETKTFELGVHRMLGMTNRGILAMLTVQALSYAIPAWAISLATSQIIAAVLLQDLETTVQVPVDKLLTSKAIGWATVLGLIIPVISSILPIREALGRNLHDTLDTRHSKTKAVEFDLERASDASISPAWLIVGLGLTIFGFCIYYLLPLSLLSFNLALFFNIFFSLLLGMLFGLVLLSLNLERFVERFVVLVCFFWEASSVSSLILKNLQAHRRRNRKTTIMFALSLGFIIFITVTANMELRSAQDRILKRAGAKFKIWTHHNGKHIERQEAIEYEQVLASSSIVNDWAWQSAEIGDGSNIFDSSAITNLGHVYEKEIRLLAISPNYFDVCLKDYLVLEETDTELDALSLAEQLYTVSGSQGAIVGGNVKEFLHLDDLTVFSDFLFSLEASSSNDNSNNNNDHTNTQLSFGSSTVQLNRMKPAAVLNSAPGLRRISRFPAHHPVEILVSFPTLMRLAGDKIESLEDVPMQSLMIDVDSDAGDDALDQLKRDITKISDHHDHGMFDFRNSKESLTKTNVVMTLLFSSATFVAMFLCLFSLMASMYTNIYEQSKEIGVLRAIGLKAVQIVKLYIYEAFTLTFAASLLGVGIGYVMGWTMLYQQILFTQMPLIFEFPYEMLITTVIGSSFCAILSAYFPTRQLVKQKVAGVFRTYL